MYYDDYYEQSEYDNYEDHSEDIEDFGPGLDFSVDEHFPVLDEVTDILMEQNSTSVFEDFFCIL